MKSPEAIKLALVCGSGTPVRCKECSYLNVTDRACNTEADADALDYIEQLEAKVPKWISVKDKMPPTGNAVLVAVHNQKMAWNCVEIDVWDGRWIENADSDWHIVTHWMPLPEPPEEV